MSKKYQWSAASSIELLPRGNQKGIGGDEMISTLPALERLLGILAGTGLW